MLKATDELRILKNIGFFLERVEIKGATEITAAAEVVSILGEWIKEIEVTATSEELATAPAPEAPKKKTKAKGN